MNERKQLNESIRVQIDFHLFAKRQTTLRFLYVDRRS